MITLKAVAPTAYQFNSVNFFGLPVRNYGGRYVAEKQFESEEEAIEYLHHVVDVYAQTDGTEEEIEAMHDQAKMGYLTYDAVTCQIVY